MMTVSVIMSWRVMLCWATNFARQASVSVIASPQQVTPAAARCELSQRMVLAFFQGTEAVEHAAGLLSGVLLASGG